MPFVIWLIPSSMATVIEGISTRQPVYHYSSRRGDTQRFITLNQILRRNSSRKIERGENPSVAIIDSQSVEIDE